MIRPQDATHVYAARKQCGCVVAVASDLGDKFTADYVRDFIKTGLTVERLSFEQWRETAFGCKCNKQPAQASLLEGIA